MEILDIEPGEERAFSGGKGFRPQDNSLTVGADVGNRNPMGFDDEIEIPRTEQGNPFAPLNPRGDTCRINGTRRKRRDRQ